MMNLNLLDHLPLASSFFRKKVEQNLSFFGLVFPHCLNFVEFVFHLQLLNPPQSVVVFFPCVTSVVWDMFSSGLLNQNIKVILNLQQQFFTMVTFIIVSLKCFP